MLACKRQRGSCWRVTQQTDVPWITFPLINSGVGRGFLSYVIDANYATNGRTGTVTVGDAKINVRQSGYAKAVSAASFTATLAPESIASVFSLGMGNSINIASTTPLPTMLGGMQVKVRSVLGNERLAPLFFTSPEQINFLVPAGTTSGTATIFINNTFNYGTVQIASVAPGFFTANASGQGVEAAIALRFKADGSQQDEPVAEFDPIQNRIVARPIDLGKESETVFLLLRLISCFRSSASCRSRPAFSLLPSAPSRAAFQVPANAAVPGALNRLVLLVRGRAAPGFRRWFEP